MRRLRAATPATDTRQRAEADRLRRAVGRPAPDDEPGPHINMPEENEMDWAGIYRDTVRHMLPQSQPYAAQLREFVLAHHAPVTTWTAEARAMLDGFGRIRVENDLVMLAAMVERGTLAMLPAVAMADLIERTMAEDWRSRAIGEIGHGHLTAMLPLDQARSEDLARTVAAGVVRHVMQAVEWLNMAARNAAAPPGSREDLTSNTQRDAMAPIWIMATSVVMPAVPIERIASGMTTRMAA